MDAEHSGVPGRRRGFATGVMKKSEMPDTENQPVAELAPSSKRTPAEIRELRFDQRGIHRRDLLLKRRMLLRKRTPTVSTLPCCTSIST
jgi:hypothetical protein